CGRLRGRCCTCAPHAPPGSDEGSGAVTRCAVVVRVAVPSDVPSLVSLWAQLRELGGGSRFTRTGGPAAAEVVAEAEDRVVGMAILSLSRIGQLLDAVAVELHHLVVADGYRRRGVGRALV